MKWKIKHSMPKILYWYILSEQVFKWRGIKFERSHYCWLWWHDGKLNVLALGNGYLTHYYALVFLHFDDLSTHQRITLPLFTSVSAPPSAADFHKNNQVFRWDYMFSVAPLVVAFTKATNFLLGSLKGLWSRASPVTWLSNGNYWKSRLKVPDLHAGFSRNIL